MSGACGPGHLGGCHGLAGVLAQPAMSTAGAAGAMLAASTANSLLTRQGFLGVSRKGILAACPLAPVIFMTVTSYILVKVGFFLS